MLIGDFCLRALIVLAQSIYFNPYLLVLLGRLTELLNFIAFLLLQANHLLDRSHLLTA
ncbi:hypothetical protein [uncultured Campylobacter sp.]|uniref:hypothetical protein n=1 Tax=uncultured Campylobacter sp. TaxID=218934 RepID=UPI0026188D72|nr:hypothetical protein [uncultured Campylobacter sp.]